MSSALHFIDLRPQVFPSHFRYHQYLSLVQSTQAGKPVPTRHRVRLSLKGIEAYNQAGRLKSRHAYIYIELGIKAATCIVQISVTGSQKKQTVAVAQSHISDVYDHDKHLN